MYEKKEMDKLIEAGKGKIKGLENNFKGYLTSSILAGAFVGFGVIFSTSVAAVLKGTPFERIGLSIVFPMALSMVVFLKVELFTSGTFILSFGKMKQELELSKVIKTLIICYFGNWIGSIILALLFIGTGSADGNVGEYISNLALIKSNFSMGELFFKGVLCNILVCLASWATFRMNSESAKLIIIFWCLFAMTICGFEHSVANMTTFTIGILKTHSLDINLFGYLYNLLWVTLGNIVGGVIFVALPCYVMHRD